MKKITSLPKASFNLLMRAHLKTSSWVAQKIGPIVFSCGAKKVNWNFTTQQLLQFPKGTIGKELGEFLKLNHLEPLAKAEYHDIHHVLFNYSISFIDEVALQFFLHGNGKKSIASVLTMIGSWCIVPWKWSYFIASYKKGKHCKDISQLNLNTILNCDLMHVKMDFFENLIND